MKKAKSSTWHPKPSTGWACIHCGRGFPSIKDMEKHIDEVHSGILEEEEKQEDEEIKKAVEEDFNKEPAPAPQEIKPIPLELTYKWTGTCPQCHQEVETIILDIDINKKPRHFAVAYCNNCKKKLKSKQVEELS